MRKGLQLIGLISDEAKPSGKRSAGKPHAAFEVAGAGDGIHLRITAPVLDPTWTFVREFSPLERREAVMRKALAGSTAFERKRQVRGMGVVRGREADAGTRYRFPPRSPGSMFTIRLGISAPISQELARKCFGSL